MMFVIDPTAINKQSQTEQSYPKLGDFPSSIKKKKKLHEVVHVSSIILKLFLNMSQHEN